MYCKLTTMMLDGHHISNSGLLTLPYVLLLLYYMTKTGFKRLAWLGLH